ncbi:MAG: hypothetical protein JXB49_31355 [Bacteroidales bacterium]|nr:hypothetical protein [Bacteroidales bacterium]
MDEIKNIIEIFKRGLNSKSAIGALKGIGFTKWEEKKMMGTKTLIGESKTGRIACMINLNGEIYSAVYNDILGRTVKTIVQSQAGSVGKIIE